MHRDLPSRFISDIIFRLPLRTNILTPHSPPIHPILNCQLQVCNEGVTTVASLLYAIGKSNRWLNFSNPFHAQVASTGLF